MTENKHAETPAGHLELKRSSEFMNWIRKFKVYLDGKQIGTIKNGATKIFGVSCGIHDIHLQIDWSESDTVTVDVRPGETIHLKCGSNCSLWDSFKASQLGPGAYIYLEISSCRRQNLGNGKSRPTLLA